MRAWKKSSILLLAMLAAVSAVQAEETKAETGKKKHMVDMADGLNTQDFYNETNPDGIWSSDLKTPWAKSTAINAYEDDKTAGSDSAKPAVETSTAGAATGASNEVTGKVNGKNVDVDQLVNIRVLYTLNPENSRASFSPVSAQNELFRQMSKTCSNGFQKVAEWSEPVEGDDYYLYYQFKCMPKR